eukprot:TRINITY_DN6498_c0_g2_i1.p1 TRINITY_DN6498_c0_g2~~TRINITY_DN6498_c0_g2_i1.p1  ORF type:complete len:120 (-),score=16.75 TRINITY_DN6498_c0_g2_i1:65-424(-)
MMLLGKSLKKVGGLSHSLNSIDADDGLGKPLRITGVGAGAWGSVFVGMLQQMYGDRPDLVDVRIWRRAGRVVKKETIGALKYVSGRLGDRELSADEILSDGLCLNLPSSPLCPLKVCPW